MAELWDKMDSLSRLSDLFPDVSRQHHVRMALWPGSSGPSLLVIGILVIWSLPELSQRVSFPRHPGLVAEHSELSRGHFDEIYETSIGEHSSVNLPDGTEVILNTNSLVQVNYTDTERYIHLSRGEAHFSVADDNSRPLTVHAGNRFFRVVGTAFQRGNRKGRFSPDHCHGRHCSDR